jgi:arylsulfatase
MSERESAGLDLRDYLDCIRSGIVVGLCIAAFDAAFVLLVTQAQARFEGTYIIDVWRSLLLHAAVGLQLGLLGATLVALATYFESAVVRAIGRALVPVAWTYAIVLGFFASYGSAWISGEGIARFAAATAAAAAVAFVSFRRSFDRPVPSPAVPKLRTSAVVVAFAVLSTGVWTTGRDRDSFVDRALAGLSTPSDTAGRPDAGSGQEHPNILLITIDTLRADHIGAYGYSDIATPAIDALARRGVLFERMIAQSSWTRSSFGSIWTSRSPSFHGANWKLVVGDGEGRNDTLFSDGLDPRLPTLAEILHDAGYRTAGINTNIQTAAMFGFDKGFDHFVDFSRPLSLLEHTLLCKGLEAHRDGACDELTTKDESYEYQPADRVLATAQRMLDGLGATGEPFFLWVHFMDPHGPYKPHRGKREVIDYSDLKKWLDRDDADLETARRRLTEAYDEEIEFTDTHVGRLLSGLDVDPSLRNTVVVLTADHGEELVERWRPPAERGVGLELYNRGYGHGHTMYEEVIHVPLIVRLPGDAHAGTRIPWIAQHVDVAPTLLSAAGVEAPQATRDFEGIDLLPYLVDKRAPAERVAKSEANLYGPEVRSLRSETYKVVERAADGKRELYDLLVDPREQRDESKRQFATAFELGTAFDEWVATLPQPPVGDGVTADAAGVDARLKALGYIE